METELSNQKRAIFNSIHHAVLVSYAARPESCQRMFQCFWFSDSGEWFTLNFFNQLVDSLDHLFIVFLPIQVVFPCLVREN